MMHGQTKIKLYRL